MDTETLKRGAIVFGLIALFVIGIYQLFRFVSNQFTATSSSDSAQSQEIMLSNYDTDTSYVRLTIDGPIIAREDHRAIRITISPQERKLEILRGYMGSVALKKVLKNDQEAYKTFLKAIEYEGFAKEQKGKFEDEVGVCPLKTRTIVEVYDANQQVLKLWSASCDRKAGTLAGDVSDLQKLFQKQIPNYKDLTKDIRLYVY